ncbi:hypothetical protein DSO57_1001276, partial [Entomophthora muscae]
MSIREKAEFSLYYSVEHKGVDLTTVAPDNLPDNLTPEEANLHLGVSKQQAQPTSKVP